MTDQGCMLRAYSREIVDAVAAEPRGQHVHSGARVHVRGNPTEVDVAHEERVAGRSKYSLYKLIRLNFDLITGFSLVPLQLFSMFGMLVSALALVTYIVVIVYRLLLFDWRAGFWLGCDASSGTATSSRSS